MKQVLARVRRPGRLAHRRRTAGCLLGILLVRILSCGLFVAEVGTANPGVSVEAGTMGIYLLRNDPHSQQPDPDHHYIGVRATCHRASRWSTTLGEQHFVIWTCP